MTFKNKTVFISGGSRGIGLAIGLKLASEGANIIIAAKSVVEDSRLGGTIYSSAEAITKAGSQALPVACDIRFEEQIVSAIEQGVKQFGGIDIVINNASAIFFSPTLYTPAKKFDLMQQVNVRGTFLVTQHALPYLLKSDHAHILTLSPAINLAPHWLSPSAAYMITKYSMTLLTLGWAAEFKEQKIAANTLWPITTIATAAVQNLLGGDDLMNRSRKPEILADAAFHILKRNPSECTGNCFSDEQILKQEGFNQFDQYAFQPGNTLQGDFFVD